MKLLRAAEREPLQWKNGGGMTMDVAIYPDDASLHDFDWRVSIAQVRSNGPFSLFPGIDRHLVVLDGKMNLTVADHAPVAVDQNANAITFPGDLAAKAQLVTTSLTDLNVMVRRDRFRAELFRCSPGRQQEIEVRSDVTILLSTGKARIGSFCLAPLDAVIVHRSQCGPLLMKSESGWIHGVHIWRTIHQQPLRTSSRRAGGC